MAKNEYSKISVHNHFGGQDADCKIEDDVSKANKINLKEAYKEVIEAKQNSFVLLGQTNSNGIDAAAYYLLRKFSSTQDVEIIPGTELNLQNCEHPEKTLHVVVLFDPKTNIYEVQELLRYYFIKNDKFVVTIEQFSELLSRKRAIVCIHGIKQRARSASVNPELTSELVSLSRFMPVAFEDNREFHKAVLRKNLKDFLNDDQLEWFDGAADMSAADRTPFNEIESPTVLWSGNTFDDLFYSVLVGSRRILREEDVVERVSFISRIEIDRGDNLKQSMIDCSHGINAIIGSSGSGKTLLLDMIKRKLTGNPLQADTSSIAQYETMYQLSQIHLFDADNKEIDETSNYEVVEGENLYQKVIMAYASKKGELIVQLGLNVDEEPLHQVLTSFESKMNKYLSCLNELSDCRKKMQSSASLAASATRFIEANSAIRADVISYRIDPSLKTTLEKLKSQSDTIDVDKNSTTKYFSDLIAIIDRHKLSQSLKDNTESLKVQFLSELLQMQETIEKQRGELAFKTSLQALVYGAAQAYNEKISGQAKQVIDKKQVVADSLQELANSALKAVRVNLEAKAPILSTKDIIGSIHIEQDDNSAQLSINEINTKLLDTDSISNAFPGTVGNKPKINKSAFSPPYDLGDEADVIRLLTVFSDNGNKGTLNLALSSENVIDYVIELKTEEGTFQPIEDFSAGMLSMIYVSRFLDNAIAKAGSNTIVLYDQPESNMEKTFLLGPLSDKFDELRQTHQLFVATHEPLLVVNADANEIILASNDKKIDQPNCINYVNQSFVGARGVGKLVEEIAKLIDGHPKAVKQRSDIYGGMKHD